MKDPWAHKLWDFWFKLLTLGKMSSFTALHAKINQLCCWMSCIGNNLTAIVFSATLFWWNGVFVSNISPPTVQRSQRCKHRVVQLHFNKDRHRKYFIPRAMTLHMQHVFLAKNYLLSHLVSYISTLHCVLHFTLSVYSVTLMPPDICCAGFYYI